MIKSRISTPVQIFISIRSVGASPQIGEIVRFCDFFSQLVILFFSRAHAQLEPVDEFSQFMVYTTCFRPRKVLSGSQEYQNSYWGNIPKNYPRREIGEHKVCDVFS